LAKGTEQGPGDGVDVAGVTFKHVEPMLRNAGQVEGGQSNLLPLMGVLSAKEVVTTVKPAQGILLAIKCRKS